MPKKTTKNSKASTSDSSTPGEKYDMTSDEKLERELSWCIDQLRIGLVTRKATPQQVQNSLKLIKTLSSTSAPLVKKRQVMRQTFGDYRRKMAEEEGRWEKDARRVQKDASVRPGSQKGVFLRRSNRLGGSFSIRCSKASTTGQEKTNERNIAQEFRFDFTVPVVEK